MWCSIVECRTECPALMHDWQTYNVFFQTMCDVWQLFRSLLFRTTCRGLFSITFTIFFGKGDTLCPLSSNQFVKLFCDWFQMNVFPPWLCWLEYLSHFWTIDQVCQSIQVNVELYLTNSGKGCMIGLIAYVQTTWFTSPNHDYAPVMFVGVWKPVMAGRMLSDGDTPYRVIFNPAKSILSLQNLNFFFINYYAFFST